MILLVLNILSDAGKEDPDFWFTGIFLDIIQCGTVKRVMDFYFLGILSIKTRNMVKLLGKSFDFSELDIMFVLNYEMTVTSVIQNFKANSNPILPFIRITPLSSQER